MRDIAQDGEDSPVQVLRRQLDAAEDDQRRHDLGQPGDQHIQGPAAGAVDAERGQQLPVQAAGQDALDKAVGDPGQPKQQAGGRDGVQFDVAGQPIQDGCDFRGHAETFPNRRKGQSVAVRHAKNVWFARDESMLKSQGEKKRRDGCPCGVAHRHVPKPHRSALSTHGFN
ncbi:MAG TPA: hypothetical protein VGN04_06555 [Herbaspirillum sp.]